MEKVNLELFLPDRVKSANQKTTISLSGRKEEEMQFDSRRAFERLNERLEQEGLKTEKIGPPRQQKRSIWASANPAHPITVGIVCASILIMAYLLWG